MTTKEALPRPKTNSLALSLFLANALLFSVPRPSARAHQPASLPDLSNDDLWDDGFDLDEQNPTSRLIAKKAGKKIRDGDKLQVRNSDGKLSPEFIVSL